MSADDEIGTTIEALPLVGYTVGITADRRWEEQAELLRRRGAKVMHAPTIRTLPLGPEADLLAATRAVIDAKPDVLVANTGIGIRSWFAQAESWGLADELAAALQHTNVFARGPKAAGAITSSGLSVFARAASERLDEVLLLLQDHGLQGKRVAFQEHGERATQFTDACRAEGADVIEIPVYVWEVPDDLRPAQRLIELAIGGQLQAVTFTSAPAVQNLFNIASTSGQRDALIDAFNTQTIAACVGSVCAEAAQAIGVRDPLVPERARLGPLIRELGDHLVGTGRTMRISRSSVQLRGRTLVVDGNCIELSDREAAVLALLLIRSGTVVARSTLLLSVWGRGTDPHVLEVTVGRLRKRLGPLGAAIQTVPRRGYLLSASFESDTKSS